jgi:hypothetical protein
MSFQRHRYTMDANDPDLFTDEDGRASRGRRKLGENEQQLNEAIARLTARKGRANAVTVRFVEPWSLKPRP